MGHGRHSGNPGWGAQRVRRIDRHGNFVGAITAMDAAPYRGREVVLAGTMSVKDGAGRAALWMRADGANGRLAFASSAGTPVRAG